MVGRQGLLGPGPSRFSTGLTVLSCKYDSQVILHSLFFHFLVIYVEFRMVTALRKKLFQSAFGFDASVAPPTGQQGQFKDTDFIHPVVYIFSPMRNRPTLSIFRTHCQNVGPPLG